MPTVSSEMSPQISPCACKDISDGNRSDSRRLMRASGTPPAAVAAMALRGRNANGAAPEKGPRGVNRPADDDMFKAVLGTCVPGNDGY
ncbi:hypothetical protein WJ970_04065 [Achromobacter xylosoxidans]